MEPMKDKNVNNINIKDEKNNYFLKNKIQA
jgi:hypothetical protein